MKKQKAARLHFQTFGKTLFRGSSLTLIGSSICDNTTSNAYTSATPNGGERPFRVLSNEKVDWNEDLNMIKTTVKPRGASVTLHLMVCGKGPGYADPHLMGGGKGVGYAAP